jgi:nucleolar protein 4
MIDLAPKNPFALPSVLQIDPSASSAQGLVMHGRTLEVVRALTREDAAMRKEDGEKSRQKADKRNTYLMREGGEFLWLECTLSRF